MSELDEILGLDEAARILKRSSHTLRWAAQTGRLPAKKIGRDWVTTRTGVARYMAFHRRSTTGPTPTG